MKLIHVIKGDEQLEPRTGLIIVRDVRYVFSPGRRGVLTWYTSEVHVVVKAFGWWLRITRHAAEGGITTPCVPQYGQWEMAHGRIRS